MKELLIIFCRNPELGKVKTRLAATVGDARALAIYLQLIERTREVTTPLSCDKVVYYSHFVDQADGWDNHLYQKKLQSGTDLGERMAHAFRTAFSDGYQSVCIIGTDCWELTSSVVEDAFRNLNRFDVVLGPAHDGGYYLLGATKFVPAFFTNKAWSSAYVARETLHDAERHGLTTFLLPALNDIDEEKDLAASFFR